MQNLVRSKKSIIAFFLIGIITVQFFQNCSKIEGFSVKESSDIFLPMGPEGVDDIHHPNIREFSKPQQKIQVANREYTASLVREIFTDSNYPVTDLEPLVLEWIYNRSAQYGSACNPYSTYSGRDCGGDSSNANLPLRIESNTIRESFRIQFCENILGIDNALHALLGKLEKKYPGPTPEAIIELYQLFFRGDGPTQQVVESLVDLDISLKEKNETEFNRWRALALQICESPGWQLH